jgi:hypothetical protein
MARWNPDIMHESHRAGVQFLMAELQTGMVFLNVAETTSKQESRQRNVENARTAYDAVVRLLPRVDPLPSERLDIEVKLDRLKKRLIDNGCTLQE